MLGKMLGDAVGPRARCRAAQRHFARWSQKGNLAKTKLAGHVRHQEVFEFLKRAKPFEKFHIIFADPPYGKAKPDEHFIERLLADEMLPQLLESGGIFVLEKRPSENVPPMDLWKVIRQKTYGATEVLFLSAIHDPQGVYRPQSAIL